ncbi:MAG: precorrin-2 C(20)-methyltransferase [Syntrophobacteraceae bacterium]|jgi:precorrin-2/cobalt-factor-2 C20-methyltransferase
MKFGVLYGIGVGPGDPELISMKGARILSQCQHVFVPKASCEGDSTALTIASRYLIADSQVHELLFPMVTDRIELSRHWEQSAESIAAVVKTGKDACFLTLGDPLLYSTYIYLLRALRMKNPFIEVITVPGITAFSAAAALTGFAVGEGKELVTIVPAADDLESVRKALASGGTVILMKIGKRLTKILDLLEEAGLMDQAVFVSSAGQDTQRTETDLRKLRAEGQKAGYLSIILIHTRRGEAS